ncbi:AraC family transcriptional regulator [Pyxidicoccus sp. QH1ED-7-1]|nr:AraC family transcriptional regulator [Pyxidicoccus xibeiensis]
MSLLRTRGQLYGRLEFTAPWGFEFPGGKGITLMVTRGSCFLGVDGQAPLVALAGGDFVFLSSPESYSLRSTPEAPVRPMESVVSPETFQRLRAITYDGEARGGSGTSVCLIAGCFTFATPESEWLARQLPPVIHVSASGAHAPQRFQSTLQFIDAELAENLPGASAVVDRLADVLFIQAVRSRIRAPCRDESPSWLRALADPRMGEALQLMHTEPGHAWTVPELARRVSMSRSSFAARFRELVGVTPLEHLTHWRMVRAAGMMREGRPVKLAAIASAVGYESEGAFGKVFQRVIGVSPGRYRQEHTQGPPRAATEHVTERHRRKHALLPRTREAGP